VDRRFGPNGHLHAAADGTSANGTEARPRVSVVLPCLNEERSVGLCAREALEALTRAGFAGEVVVVDNGSTDDSVSIARASGARVVYERRKGYGSALLAGIEAALGEVVVMADSDFTYDLGRVPDLVRPVLEGEADLVLGARLAGATRETMPLLHRFVGTPVLTMLVRRASGGLAVTDSQSGFRAFRREAMLGLGVRGSGMEFASEMLIQAARAGWRVREIQTRYRPRIGESKLDTFADGWRHLRLITLLAPDLVLVWPGAASLVLGVVLSLWSLVSPGGLSVGSLQWQPMFFSTIAMVFGAQALLAGSVMAHRSSLLGGTVKRRFAFVGTPRFPAMCVHAGVGSVATGLVIDLLLFMWWVAGLPAPSRGTAIASLAQSLLIVGSTVAAFGVVTRLILDRRRREVGASVLGLDDLRVPAREQAGGLVEVAM
jgi:hypothetical protein